MNKNGYNLFSRKFCFTAEILRKFRGNFVTAAVRKRISTHFGRGSGNSIDFKNMGTGRNGNEKSLPCRTLEQTWSCLLSNYNLVPFYHQKSPNPNTPWKNPRERGEERYL